MNAKHLPLQQITKQERLIQDYLSKNENIANLVSAFPSLQNFEQIVEAKSLTKESRQVLADSLKKQYGNLTVSQKVKENIELLNQENTFTITTGHQLCLFTGPLYFIYKIISAIKLSEELNSTDSSKKFIPVYWMATEDHDLAEINHAYFFGKKLIWETDQTGAVGHMRTDGIQTVIDELEGVLGAGESVGDIVALLRKAYSEKDLATATRHLVNELFGKYGLVIIDGNQPELKNIFKTTIQNELFEQTGFHVVSKTNDYLSQQEYKVQVNPREINLFYLEGNIRGRIERKDEDTWTVVDTDKSFSKAEINTLLDEHPERFSPNVVLRPLYQETILPNIAYIGGPGEIAYWLQLKAFFDIEQLPFPMLILRDSALLMSSKTLQKLDKLGLSPIELFDNPQNIIKRLVNSDITSLESEKNQIKQIFDVIATKLKAADNTLEGTALAEAQKQLSAIDHLEKKALKALKTKEENRINQFQKIYNECFPDGAPQERHDNFFQHLTAFGSTLIDDLHESFNPLQQQYHILEQEVAVH